MANASSGNTTAVFEIKSATLPLVAVLLKTLDMSVLANELKNRFGDTPDFFNGDPVAIDLTPVREDVRVVDFAVLVDLLKRYRMTPVAVRGGHPVQMAGAASVGLVDAFEGKLNAEPPVKPIVREIVKEVEIIREVPISMAQPTMVIDKPLRSGQQVYAKGGDLIVLSVVSFGAEVIADGNVHVYAPLRGKAIAGARGDTQAKIFTTCLEPELISIAGIYRTTETAIPPEVLGKGAQIRLVGERLVMEPFES